MIFIFQDNTNSSAKKVVESASFISDTAYGSIRNLLTQLIEQLPYIVAGLVVLLIFWLIGRIFRSIFLATSNRANLDDRLRVLFSRLIGVIVFILGIFAALTVIIPSFRFGDLITGLGFTSFIIGFATKDILNNLLSGVLILWKQPFHVGDYIFVKSIEGKVEYIGVRATRLRKDDGELVLVPNGEMYSNALTIRGAGSSRRMKLEISLAYEADIERAKQVIGDVLKELEGVENKPSPNVVVTDLTSDGVHLAIYFWVDTDKNSPLQVFDKVASGIKKSLRAAKAELYPSSTSILPSSEKETDDKEEEKSSDDL